MKKLWQRFMCFIGLHNYKLREIKSGRRITLESYCTRCGRKA